MSLGLTYKLILHKMKYYTGILLIVVLSSSCSSGKLIYSWTSTEGLSDLNTVLVIARSPDVDVKKAFESALVNSLRSKKVDGISVSDRFPDLIDKGPLSAEETREVKKRFVSNGIKTVVLMALKDTQTTYVETENQGSDNNTASIKGKYGVSFTDSYNVNSLEYLSKDMIRYDEEDVPIEERMHPSYNTYILEALVYDLDKNESDELVGVYNVKFVEPQSTEEIKQQFTRILTKQLTK
jgi:hypothetical protein